VSVSPTRNVFACLVHESPDCVIDLVRNLRFADPASIVLLYNGGPDPNLLRHFPFDTLDAVIVPAPKKMTWGRLHEFALDCMQFALNELTFDTLTIVDSDQLATRRGYSDYIGSFITGRNRLGMLANSPGVLPHTTTHGPAQTAFRELELWRPYLRRFPYGEQKFVHWSFWPSTVFTNQAAWDLTRLFSTDRELSNLLSQSNIWATEEIILPTLLALLGYEIAANPCSFDYVQYKMDYSGHDVDAALSRDDVFWMHPVPRKLNDPLRTRIRERLGYADLADVARRGSSAGAAPARSAGIVLSLPILGRIKNIPGWLDEQEADLLLATCNRALTSLPPAAAVLEVGSFCGRSTVLLGSVIESLGSESKVYAVDSHEGLVGAAGSTEGLRSLGSTLDIFRSNIAANGLTHIVEPVVQHSYEVAWERPIALLFIDGLHDYYNVSRDFRHFEPWVLGGGYIAFHDYADYYPGVKQFVNELIALPDFELVSRIQSLVIVRKIGTSSIAAIVQREPAVSGPAPESRVIQFPSTAIAEVASVPLASCIMPTADRRSLVPQAIRHFLRQDYPHRELIILDDGADCVADLIPEDERIRYLRLDRKLSMGVKHNLACEMARGEVIVHWDDDDWISPRRISYQVRELMEQPEEAICGLSRILFYDPRALRAWEYRYPGGRPWVIGSTFCYYKRFSERNHFPDMNEGADTTFVWNLHDIHVHAHSDHTFYVGTVHSHNTSPKRTESVGWRPLPAGEVQRLMDEEDWAFYQRFASAAS
jgi:Methyltransferase domain/Glycosyl transferase family 2